MGRAGKIVGAAALLGAAILTQAAAGAPEAPLEVELAGTKDEAVANCLAAASERMAGKVAQSKVDRVWHGSEGFIVVVTLVSETGGRRDYTCREGRYGLQVARS